MYSFSTTVQQTVRICYAYIVLSLYVGYLKTFIVTSIHHKQEFKVDENFF